MTAKLTILSIDDNAQNLSLIEKALSQIFNIVSSDGSESIVELVEQNSPSIILLDIMLKDKFGYDLCVELRSVPEYSDIIVIFVSALSSLEDKLKAYGSGGDDYICKPIDLVELTEKLKSVEKQVENTQQLKQQAKYASTTAFSSMKQANELGLLITFFTATCDVSSYEELYREIAEFFQQFDVCCSLEFRVQDEVIQFPLDLHSKLESEILNHSRNAQRIISFNNKMLINSPWCSLLIKKLPMDDEALVGRMRDHFAVLLTIIESRLAFIDSEKNRLLDRHENVLNLRNVVGNTFANIKQNVLKQESEIYKLISSLSSSFNLKMITLGLDEEQENELAYFIEDTKNEMSEIMNATNTIDNELSKINSLLKTLN